MKNWNWTLILFALLCVAIIVISELLHHQRVQRFQKQIDDIKAQREKIMDVDSLRSVIEMKFIDSLRMLRSDLEKERVARYQSEEKIRKANESNLNRYHSIDLSDRPRF